MDVLSLETSFLLPPLLLPQIYIIRQEWFPDAKVAREQHHFKNGETFKVYYRYFVYISFFTCILWIYTEANEVVGLLTALGFIWKIDSAIMGLTFLAWANSVGDLVSDISLAKAGKARTAVAACFGTPLLNLLGTV